MQKASKIEFLCKTYGWSKFRSTREKVNPEETRVKLIERHVEGS
jgi:hypothetical protein